MSESKVKMFVVINKEQKNWLKKSKLFVRSN